MQILQDGIAVCAHAIKENRFLVEDAHKDDRFASNPMVTGWHCGPATDSQGRQGWARCRP
jgi:hypothetical protein